MNICNLGILAHVDAGKTTVTEGILYHSGVKAAMGSVDRGTTMTDSLPMERQRGMTIRASTVSFAWNGHKINLIDTPGHMDFVAEVMRTLSVLDGAILVISAREGVQTQTRLIFSRLRELGIPTLLFINKVDRAGVDLVAALADIRKTLTENLVVLQDVTGEGSRNIVLTDRPISAGENAETILCSSEKLFSRYAAGDLLSEVDYRGALNRGTADASLFPVLFGSSLLDVGVVPLMDTVTELMKPVGSDIEELSALVYKLEYEENRSRRLYVRLFSGSLAVRQKVPVFGVEREITIKNLYTLSGGTPVKTDTVSAGDIGILKDIDGLPCGSFLGAPPRGRAAPAEAVPLLAVSVIPGDRCSRYALIAALQELGAEDPSLTPAVDPATDEITVRLFGRLQLEVIENALARRYGLMVFFSPLRTHYKERPKGKGSAAVSLYESGNHYYAGISLSVEPLPSGSGFQYENHVSYGYLEKPFQNAVLEGIQRGLSEGLGCEITDVCVTFLEAGYSSVMSTPSDYRALAPLVVKRALGEAGTVRVEPWHTFCLTAPAAFEKRVISDLIAMRAAVENVGYSGDEFTVSGRIPLDTSKDYSAELPVKIGGKGVFQSQFLGFF